MSLCVRIIRRRISQESAAAESSAIHHPARDVLRRAIFICYSFASFLFMSILFTRYCSRTRNAVTGGGERGARCNMWGRCIVVSRDTKSENVNDARAADRRNLRDGGSRTRPEWQIIFPPSSKRGSPIVIRSRIRPRNRQAIHQDRAVRLQMRS